MTRPKVDSSMSESGKYGEPSFSTVVLPEPPAWLNIDEVLPYDERQQIKDVIEAGREVLDKVADWAEWARSTMSVIEAAWVKSDALELEGVRECLGIRALNDVMFLIDLIGGNPAGRPGTELRAMLRVAYPQYAKLIGMEGDAEST